MIRPIRSINIFYTDTKGRTQVMLLEAPNGEDPFFFSIGRMNIRGKFRDKNNILRRKYDLHTVKWSYNYISHTMDLRKLLTAVEITLLSPPNFVGNYQSHPVFFLNKEAVKNYLEGLPIGNNDQEIPSGSVTLEFEIKVPLTWQEVLAFQTFEQDQTPPPVPDAPENFSALATGSDVSFSWDDVDGVDGYNLYLDTGSGFVKHNSALIETNSYLIEGIQGGDYDAYVVSVLGIQESDPSNEDSFEVLVYYTDFSEYAINQHPNDWTNRWDLNGQGWEVVADAGATGGKVFQKVHDAVGRRWAISWDILDGIENALIEYKFKGYFDAGSSNHSDPRFMIRGSGVGGQTGLVHGYRFGANGKRLGGYNSSSYVTIQDIAFSADLDIWYNMKIEVNGNNHRLKMWKETDSEPGSWDMDEVNSVITIPGWVGFMSFGYRTYDIDWLKVTKL